MFYNIPSHLPFAETFLAGLLKRYKEPENVLIYLPSLQAKQAFYEAVASLAEKQCERCRFLPEIRAIGEGEEGRERSDSLSHRRRLLEVVRLLKGQKIGSYIRRASPARLFKLAPEFLALYDSALLNRADLKKIDALVSREEWAGHWQKLLEALRVIIERYPKRVREQKLEDPRQAEIEELDNFQPPPGRPLIVAGATGGGLSAYIEFIRKAAQTGSVALPGLDTEMDETTWLNLPPTHPQYAMRQLLGELPRLEVGDWWQQESKAGEGKKRRIANLRRIMRPPSFENEPSGSAPRQRLSYEDDWPGVRLIKAEDEHSEASLIALALIREERRGGRATLITSDRELARMVAAELASRSYAVDDSTGIPLRRSKTAEFLILLLTVAGGGEGSSSATLSLLSHPLAEPTLNDEELELAQRQIGADIWEIKNRLRTAKADKQLSEKLKFYCEKMSPLRKELRESRDLGQILQTHLETAQTISKDLWAEDESIAEIFCELLDAAATSDLKTRNYPELFLALIADDVIRPKSVLRAKISIESPLHARFKSFDLAVLGGLSEGSWPPSPRLNPWLSPGMMKKLGLGDLKIRIGLAAHDFTQCFGSAERLILTTAARRKNKPMERSRWLERLEYLTDEKPQEENELPQLLRALNKVEAEPRPMPQFELPKRAPIPASFALSDLKYLKDNPYVFYVRAFLKLKPSRAMTEDFARIKGELAHRLAEGYATDPSPQTAKKLSARLLLPYRRRPEDYLFLQSYLSSFAESLSNWESEGEVFAELEGRAKLGDYLIKTRVDRIEVGERVRIIDFKTGSTPTKTQVETFIEPQLPLMAYVLEQNGFAPIQNRKAELSFYLTVGHDEAFKVFPKGGFSDGNLKQMTVGAAELYERLLNKLCKEGEPFLTLKNDKFLTHIIRFAECA